jgi:hypothetical protein
VVASDLRAATGMQDFAASAPLDLVYFADFGKMNDPAPPLDCRESGQHKDHSTIAAAIVPAHRTTPDLRSLEAI